MNLTMAPSIMASGSRTATERAREPKSGRMVVSTPALGKPIGFLAKGDSYIMMAIAMRASGSMIRPKE